MVSAVDIFEETIEWLKKNYSSFNFFVERDVVWTVQKHLIEIVRNRKLPYKIFNDHPILPGNRRSLSADIAILDEKNAIAVAVEFKYEPAHNRPGILKSKLPVVFWGDDGVGKDVKRINEFIQVGNVKTAYSIFIDEGGAFAHREPHPGSKWISWGNSIPEFPSLYILWSKKEKGA